MILLATWAPLTHTRCLNANHRELLVDLKKNEHTQKDRELAVYRLFQYMERLKKRMALILRQYKKL